MDTLISENADRLDEVELFDAAAFSRCVPSLLPNPLTTKIVIDLVDDPYTNISTFKRIIMSDIAMYATLMNRASRVNFSKTSKVETLSDAFVVLGWNRIRGILVTLCLPNLNREITKEEQLMWIHSLSRTVFAKEIAEVICPHDREQILSLALAAGIGRTLLVQFAPRHYAEVIEQTEAGFVYNEAEQTSLGSIGSSVSLLATLRWNLGRKTELVLKQLSTGESKNPVIKKRANILALAELTALELGYGRIEGYPSMVEMIQVNMKRLGIDSRTMAQVKSRGRTYFDDLQKMLLTRQN